jgi:hypothetical protein
MAYLIAAYAVVFGSLAVYGFWLQGQRRALMRQARERERSAREGSG